MCCRKTTSKAMLNSEPVATDEKCGLLEGLDSNKSTRKIVTLNVGGIKYVTSVSTLTKFGDKTNHMLCCMFNGKFSTEPDLDKKEHFIDRDGTYFNHILNFLRDGESFQKNILPHLEYNTKIQLKQESLYYGLYELMFENDFEVVWKDVELFDVHARKKQSDDCRVTRVLNRGKLQLKWTKTSDLGTDVRSEINVFSQPIPWKWIENGCKASFYLALSPSSNLHHNTRFSLCLITGNRGCDYDVLFSAYLISDPKHFCKKFKIVFDFSYSAVQLWGINTDASTISARYPLKISKENWSLLRVGLKGTRHLRGRKDIQLFGPQTVSVSMGQELDV